MRLCDSATLRLGFDGADDVADAAIDLYGEDDGYPGDALVKRLTRERLDALLQEQRGWARPTDAERLDAVFGRLNAAGILARHNYAPTRTWGRGELLKEAKNATDRGLSARGFVFYTSQDAEELSDGSLHLAFGAKPPPGSTHAEMAQETHAVAQDIDDHLTADGLDVDWDGGVDSAMLVENLDWKCPRDAVGHPLLENAVIEPTPGARVSGMPRGPTAGRSPEMVNGGWW